MSDTQHLESMLDRMTSEQQKLLMQAAEMGILPASGALEQIASFEGALEGVDALIELRQTAGRTREKPAKAAVTAEPAQEPSGAPGTLGTVKWFNAIKGYGFIRPDQDGPDVFVHASAVERANLRTLAEGQRVAYELKRDARTGKNAADQLRLVE